MVCGNAYVNFIALGYGPFHMWRSRCQLEVLFTRRGTVTCMFRSHVQLLFTLCSDSKLRDFEHIYHCRRERPAPIDRSLGQQLLCAKRRTSIF